MNSDDYAKICDWIDDKIIATKDSTIGFREKLAIYNTIADLQDFLKKKKIEEDIEEARNGTGVHC